MQPSKPAPVQSKIKSQVARTDSQEKRGIEIKNFVDMVDSFNSGEISEKSFSKILDNSYRLYSYIPINKRSDKLLSAVVSNRSDGIRAIGINKSDEEMCKLAVDKWGSKSLQVMYDKCKTESVLLYALNRDQSSFIHISKKNQTQEICNLAFTHSSENIKSFRHEFIQPWMLESAVSMNVDMKHAEIPLGAWSKSAADYFLAMNPKFISRIPEEFLSVQSMAEFMVNNPNEIGTWEDTLKSTKALRIAMSIAGENSELHSTVVKLSRSFEKGPKAINSQMMSTGRGLSTTDRKRFYAKLLMINADIPEKLEIIARKDIAVLDLMKVLYGLEFVLSKIPDAQLKGKWLEEGLGL